MRTFIYLYLYACVYYALSLLCEHHHHHHFPLISNTSISNCKVPPGGIPHAGNPPRPYPSSAGISNARTSPNRIPKHPWSHPVITAPTPAWYWNGFCPSSFVDQNFVFVCETTPVAWTRTVSPLETCAPDPILSVLYVVAKPGRDCMMMLLLLTMCFSGCVLCLGKKVWFKNKTFGTKTYSNMLTTTSQRATIV